MRKIMCFLLILVLVMFSNSTFADTVFSPMGTGAGQSWGQYGAAFNGYSSGMYSYVMPEAGVEIVYKGVGVGVTAAYLYTLDMEVSKLNWDDILRRAEGHHYEEMKENPDSPKDWSPLI